MKLKLFEIPKRWLNSMKELYLGVIAEVAEKKIKKSDFADAHFIDKAFTWATAESYTLFNKETALFFAENKYTHEIYKSSVAIEFINKKLKEEGLSIIGEKAFEKIFKISATEAVNVYEHIKETVSEAIKEGIKEGTPKKEMAKILTQVGLSQSYAEMVYQTCTNTAINGAIYNGAIKSGGKIEGLRFVAVMDSKTRGNHGAAHGLEQPIDSKFWDYLFPPLGYNCRCNVVPVRKLKKYIPAMIKQARPDYEWFGKRPLTIY